MAQETSVGVALFRKANAGTLEFLLLKHPQGHWDFPKGHVESGETERLTAARELTEETGLDAAKLDWVSDFRCSVEYSYAPPGKNERSKEVHYLAASTDEDPGVVRLSEEHLAWGWFSTGSTLQRLTYDSSKRVLIALIGSLTVRDKLVR